MPIKKVPGGCSEDGCDAEVCAQGLCKKHYYTARRSNRIYLVRTEKYGPTCTMPGCGLDHVAKGLCLKHYKQARRRGFQPLVPVDTSGWTPTIITWVAGLFEGEVSLQRRVKGYRIQVNITDLDVAQKIQNSLGIGTVSGPYMPKNPKHKPVWTWSLGRWRLIEPLLSAIYPHMCERRKGQIDWIRAAHAQRTKDRAQRSKVCLSVA
jgi:hypothetical protein